MTSSQQLNNFLEEKALQETKRCALAKKCGGCRYTGVPYPEQLEIKQKNEEELLGRFGKIDRILGMRYPCFYRNKVTAAFGKDKKGNTQ